MAECNKTKRQSGFKGKITPAANARLMEALLDNWLKNSHHYCRYNKILFQTGLITFDFLPCTNPATFIIFFYQPHIYHCLTHYYLCSLLVSGVFYTLQFTKLISQGWVKSLYFLLWQQKYQTRHFNLSKQLKNI